MWTLFLSLRYFLTKHHKEGMISLISLISILGVAVGVASLIVVISVMNGFDAEVKDKIIGTYAHVVITKDSGINDPVKLTADIEKLPGVVNASTFITGQAVLENGKSFNGVLVKGIDPAKEAEVSSIIKYTGGSGRELGPGTIILGSELMRSEGVSVGDTVELIVPYTPIDMEKHKLKVLGAFTSGRYDYDANIVVVSDGTAREIFRMGDKITGIALKVADSMKVADLKVVLQDALGPGYVVRTWMDLDRNLVAALALEKKMMFLILALIVMVACFNISGSLIMMVMEKTKDIGVLKAIGASSFGVSVVFILQLIWLITRSPWYFLRIC